MRPTIRLNKYRLTVRCDDPALDGAERELNADDAERFDRWIETYRKAVEERGDGTALVDLGEEIHAWLDGDGRWLEKLVAVASRPMVIEFATSRSPNGVERRFLDVPWELVARDGFHLAEMPDLAWSPVRRLGNPAEPPPPSTLRLSAVFMAAEPRGRSVPLSYESEESAILDAAGSIGMDLIVEESGSLPLLADCLAREAPVDVLHISCHGTDQPRPMLSLEDDEGNSAPARAGDLDDAIASARPRLLFLSACLTAGVGNLVGSLATETLKRGQPAVLGWSGSVGDTGATRFAETLYTHLARGATLEEATARARLDLLDPDGKRAFQSPLWDWHLARLFLGPTGGGLLSAGTRKRRIGAAERGRKEFLDAKGRAVPVAGRREFVGRRRQIQDILRAFRRFDQYPGVLIRGMGRQGKSSLAARIANRMPDHRTVVVFGRYDAPAVLGAIDGALPFPAVHEIVTQYRDAVTADPTRLAEALTAILEGPCADLTPGETAGGFLQRLRKLLPGGNRAGTSGGTRPILLIIDDFEQALEDPPPGGERCRVKPDAVDAAAAVVTAFWRAETTSRLILTSRFRFALPSSAGADLADRLFDLPLPPMADSEGQKQAAAKARYGDLRPTAAPTVPRTRRCIDAARGNPGLLDLLFSMALTAPEACDAALDEMDAYARGHGAPTDAELVRFLENLALDRLMGLLSDPDRELLRISTLFTLPVPIPVMERAAGIAGLRGDGELGARLLTLGLWEVFEDAVDPALRDVAVNDLARPRAGTLTGGEIQTLAAPELVEDLFARWGGKSGGYRRPDVLDYELSRLAVVARVAEILAVTARRALIWLNEQFRYREAARMAVDVISLLDKAGITPETELLRAACERCDRVGDKPNARVFIQRAVKAFEGADGKGGGYNPAHHAMSLGIQGRLLVADGNVQDALASFEKSESLFESIGAIRERAVTLGDIARIRVDKGEVEEALRLQKEVLRVYEDLGDRRSRAVTLGDIARIRVSKGEVEEALRLHEEMLRVFEDFGDRRERAVTLGDIARIRVSKGEVEEALRLHEEELRVYEDLGDRRSRAVTLGDIARIRVRKGEVEEALRLHEEELRVYEDLGDRRSRAVTLGDIARIRVDKGEVEEALRLHEERLRVFEDLGDRRSRAVTLGDIARIRVSKGEVEEALRLHEEMLRVFEDLGDRRERAVTLGDIARIRVSKGEVEEALRLHEERLRVFEDLGDRRERAVTLGDIARIRVSKGEVEEALRLHEEELRVYEDLGDRRSRAVTLGDIARIRVDKGEVEEALRLHEERLRVFEDLGDRRERAVTLGDIARIRVDKGEVEEALRLHEEMLRVFEDLGDIDGIANALWSIAKIYLQTGRAQEAYDNLSKSYEINMKLGRLDGICFVGMDLGMLLCRAGHPDQGLPILQRSLEGFRKLGQENMARQVAEIMARVNG